MVNYEKFLVIPKIEEGIVIDHIPVGLGAEIVRALSFFKKLRSTPVTLGLNFSSRRLGKKDLIKLQIVSLPEQFLHYLALIAPGVSIKQIQGCKVQRKIVAQVPEIITMFIKCPNPRCISNSERGARTSFHCVESTPLKYMCHYCERHFPFGELEIIPPTLPKIQAEVK